MGEWERPHGPSGDEPLSYIEGGSDRIYEMKERFRVKNDGCSSCVYNSRCMGFEKWYSDIFGSGEFRPVTKAAVPVGLAPSFRRLAQAQALVGRPGGAGKCVRPGLSK